MRILYHVGIAMVKLVMKMGSFRSEKLGLAFSRRRNLFAELITFRKAHPSPLVWFHVASLGEYEQAKPVIRAFKEKFPFWAVAVSFFSPSGYENVVKKKQPWVDFFTYIPFDSPKEAKKFVAILHPNAAIFVKYDLWANHIREIKKGSIPLFLIAASFRKEQVYFKWPFFGALLRSFDHIFTQNTESVSLLKIISMENATVTGDPRFDNVWAISQQPKYFPEIKAKIHHPVMVLGSMWQEDMDLLIPYINQSDDQQFIIAPHDIHGPTMEKWQKAIHKCSIKYSELSTKAEHSNWQVLFIDNIGMLSSLYQFAKWAYVGGAFGKGLHNILEPLAFGIPVVFGKLRKSSKFPEAGISEVYGCGFSVANFQELDQTMTTLMEEEAYEQSRRGAKKLLEENLGSAEKIMQKIKTQLWKEG